MMDSNPAPQICGDSCAKNKSLVKEYEKLIQLYKRKCIRQSQELSSRNSHARTTSHTSAIDSQETRNLRLAHAVQLLIQRRCSPFFVLASRKSAKKFVMKSIANKVYKICLRTAFSNILEIREKPCLRIARLLERLSRKRLEESFDLLQTKNGMSVVQQQIKDTLPNQELCQQTVVSAFKSFYNSHCNSKYEGAYWLRRRNIQLEVTNQKLRLENQFLRQGLQESSRRQAKENHKKKQSLEMLAEELLQKNDIIQDLKTSLQSYEKKYDANANVLEDDVVQLRKDLDHVEKVRDKLQMELSRSRDRIGNLNKKNEQLEERNCELQRERNKLCKIAYEAEIYLKRAEEKNEQVQKTMSIFRKKMKRIATYEREGQKILQNTLKQSLKRQKNILGQSENLVASDEPSFIQQSCGRIIDTTKTELVLCFLANIDVLDYEFRTKNLFDEEEIRMLIEHKNAYLTLKQEKEMAQNYRIDPIREDRLISHQMEMRGGASGSLFNALDSPKSLDSEERNDRKEKGITLKLLELQLEKNKQIEKISELKQKIMHIRVIVLNLLRSLELQQVKAEAQSILDVIFDMFEYSEQERDNIFVKKKKLLGFF